MSTQKQDERREPLVTVQNLKKYFTIKDKNGKKGTLKAVDNVSFTVYKGETFGIVGESGCGKSTMGRSLLNLYPIDGGSIDFAGVDVTNMTKQEKKRFCFNSQLVFQDPSACLNPRKRIGSILAEPFKIYYGREYDKAKAEKRIDELLDVVGLAPDYKRRYPHEMSGGQKQRIGIARALALNPKLIICDEPVSALDVSIQAQVINLLVDLQKKMDLTYMFISHDLGVVYHLCKRIVVMYLGKALELADKDDLYSDTLHPYTKALISAAPTIDGQEKERILLEGDVPSPADPPSGCKFHTRCPHCMDQCVKTEPELKEVKPEHFVACHLYK